MNVLICSGADFYFEDKPPNIYGQMAHNTDPNTTPELSPVANDDVVEGAVLDEVDEDDPFSKRRYYHNTGFIYFFSYFMSMH